MSAITIRRAETADNALVTDFALALTQEIMARTGTPHFDIDRVGIEALCARYLESGIYSVLLAQAGHATVGFATLCESHALYVGGAFGIVQEFYVEPAWRSRSVGRALLDGARREAGRRGWLRLELCTPPLPEFDRTLAFYAENGFEITGGRKMKCPVGPG